MDFLHNLVSPIFRLQFAVWPAVSVSGLKEANRSSYYPTMPFRVSRPREARAHCFVERLPTLSRRGEKSAEGVEGV